MHVELSYVAFGCQIGCGRGAVVNKACGVVYPIVCSALYRRRETSTHKGAEAKRIPRVAIPWASQARRRSNVL